MSEVKFELLLCGDVMLGRGLDQILPHPGDPALHEAYVESALDYLALAERAHGPIPRGLPFAYPWGEALAALTAGPPERPPTLSLVNLETAVTRRGRPAPKGINYRMTPENLPVLQAAGIDCCALANNHVLDWGEEGLEDTLAALAGAGLPHAGAGRDGAAAAAPAALPLPGGGRLLVWACGTPSSGVPAAWAAGAGRAGVNFLGELSEAAVARVAEAVRAEKGAGDLALLSIHWGGNWGYEIADAQRRFARALVERAGIDVVHGHSSHHPRALEAHRDRAILYGCGDFLNDYEGIPGYEAYRGDLVLLYRLGLAADGRLLRLEMLPFRIRRFRLQRAAPDEAGWLRRTLDRECRRFGGAVELEAGLLRLRRA